MQAGDVVAPLCSRQQEAQQILVKCALEVRGDPWIILPDLVIKYRDVALEDSKP